jgi:hypothetical protein
MKTLIKSLCGKLEKICTDRNIDFKKLITAIGIVLGIYLIIYILIVNLGLFCIIFGIFITCCFIYGIYEEL